MSGSCKCRPISAIRNQKIEKAYVVVSECIRTWTVYPRDIQDVRKRTTLCVKGFESYRVTNTQTGRQNGNYISTTLRGWSITGIPGVWGMDLCINTMVLIQRSISEASQGFHQVDLWSFDCSWFTFLAKFRICSLYIPFHLGMQALCRHYLKIWTVACYIVSLWDCHCCSYHI